MYITLIRVSEHKWIPKASINVLITNNTCEKWYHDKGKVKGGNVFIRSLSPGWHSPLCVRLCKWIMNEWKCPKFYYILDTFTKSQHVFIRITSRMKSDAPVVEKGKKNTVDEKPMTEKEQYFSEPKLFFLAHWSHVISISWGIREC